jgi:predicted nuclease of predicted toxin-antitoxin system
MLRLVSDGDFDGRLYRTLRKSRPELDLVRVQDVGLRTAPDPDILAWAAAEDRIVISQDYDTMPKFAYERIDAGLPMPGLLIVRRRALSIGKLAEEILIVVLCSEPHEWRDRVGFIPL